MKNIIYLVIGSLIAGIFLNLIIGEFSFLQLFVNTIFIALLSRGVGYGIFHNISKRKGWNATFVILGLFLVFNLIGFSSMIYLENEIKNIKDTKGKENIVTSNREIKKTWKQFLKDNNIALDISKVNQFETLQQNNIYTNYYYNIATDFPDNWEVDRGNSEMTVLRTSIRELGTTLFLNVVPNQTNEDSKFEKSPLKYMNTVVKGNYEDYFKKMMNRTGVDIYDVVASEETIRNKTYLKTTYSFDEITNDDKVKFKVCNYQTMVFNLTYSFIYSTPEIFYDQNIIDDVVFSANFAKIRNKLF